MGNDSCPEYRTNTKEMGYKLKQLTEEAADVRSLILARGQISNVANQD